MNPFVAIQFAHRVAYIDRNQHIHQLKKSIPPEYPCQTATDMMYNPSNIGRLAQKPKE